MNHTYQYKQEYHLFQSQLKPSLIMNYLLAVPSDMEEGEKLPMLIFLQGFTYTLFTDYSKCSKIESKEPYVTIKSVAVLGPTLGTPGILSEVSPINAFNSINWIGVTCIVSKTSLA